MVLTRSRLHTPARVGGISVAQVANDVATGGTPRHLHNTRLSVAVKEVLGEELDFPSPLKSPHHAHGDDGLARRLDYSSGGVLRRTAAAARRQLAVFLASFYYVWYAFVGRTKTAAAAAASEHKRKAAAARPAPVPRHARRGSTAGSERDEAEETVAAVVQPAAAAAPGAAQQTRFGCFFLFQLLAALLFWLLVYRLSIAFVAPLFGFRPPLMATTIIEDTGIDMGLIHNLAVRIQAVETANRAIGPEVERLLAMEISDAAQRTTDAAVARAIAAAEVAATNAASAMLASMPRGADSGDDAPAAVAVDEALLRPTVEAAVREALDARVEAVLASVHDGEKELQAELADVRSVLQALGEEVAQARKIAAAAATATPLPHTDGEASGLSLADVQSLIASELERYAADQIGLVDYAQASAGGFIYGRHTSPPLSVTSTSLLGWLPLLGDFATVSHLPATVALERNNDVGNCWAFGGRQGHVTIGLSEPIRVSHVTVDHIPASIARHVSSAPRDFALFGYRTEQDVEAGRAIALGSYTYTTTGPAVQTFAVPELERTSRSMALDDVMSAVRLEFNSNHGHEFYTCVYRIRVHGSPAFSTKDVVHVMQAGSS